MSVESSTRTDGQNKHTVHVYEKIKILKLPGPIPNDPVAFRKDLSEELKVNMSSIAFKTDHGIFNGEIMLYVNDTRHLEMLISKLEKVEGMVSVYRFDSRSN